MAILAFQKPDKVIMLEADENYGKFEFRPLEPGYGVTVGNALRRILLSSLEGYAITTVKIEGVEHEFSTVKGVVEDITEIILAMGPGSFTGLRVGATVANALGYLLDIPVDGKKELAIPTY